MFSRTISSQFGAGIPRSGAGRGASRLLSERGSGGMRFLIILYALGITLIALQPLKRYWAPYLHSFRKDMESYGSWGEPPKRKGATAATSAAPEVVVRGGEVDVVSRKSRAASAESSGPVLDKLTSGDKAQLDSLIDHVAAGHVAAGSSHSNRAAERAAEKRNRARAD